MTWSRIRSFIIAEVKEVVPPVVFFAVSFNLVVLTTQLILDDYGGQFANFLVATTAALVVGKAVTNGECAAVPPPLRWGAPDPTHPIQDRRLCRRRLPVPVPGKARRGTYSVAEPLAGFPITSASILHGTVSLPSRFGCSFCFSSIQPYLS